MGKPMVYRDSVYTEHQVIQANTDNGNLPITIAAGASVTITTAAIVVPSNEYWLLSAAGYRILTSAAGIVLDAFSARFQPGTRVQVLNQGGGAGGSTLTVPAVQIPIVNNNNTPTTFAFAGSLSGIELFEGDTLLFGAVLRNPTAGGIDVTNVVGGMRYRPLTLVTEQQVAQIQVARQDFALDARLRGTRG